MPYKVYKLIRNGEPDSISKRASLAARYSFFSNIIQ